MPIDDDLQTTLSGFHLTILSPEEAMFMAETHGKTVVTAPPEGVKAEISPELQNKLVFVKECDWELFQLYKIGKEQRDFHVTEWKLGVKQRVFVPEEFYGVLGMVSPSEFRGVFGRDLDPHLLAIQARELQEEIRFYESLLSCEGNSSI